MKPSFRVGLLLILAACEPPGPPADLILFNGNVWTGEADAPTAEAVAVRDGRIVLVSGDSRVLLARGPDTDLVDLGGRSLLPGFVDAHVHFISGGFGLSGVDLRVADTPEDFIRRLRDFAEGLEPGDWITGGDWDHEAWGGELPRRDWVDSVTANNPVLVTRLDGHMALANSRALELARVDRGTQTPSGGEIVRDANGRPTGVLRDAAMNLVSSVIPAVSDSEQDRAFEAAATYAVSKGVTQVHDMGSWADLATYRRARAAGRMPLRVYSVVPMSTWERLRDLVEREGTGDDRLWWGGLKAFVDGSLGSTTAWFYDPYLDAPNTSGLLTTDTAALRGWVQAADRSELQTIVHAIGDRANDWLLDVFAETQRVNGPRDRRQRVEHAQHLTAEAIPRFSTLDVIPSMQPYHAADDGRWADKRIGPERIERTYAFRALLDAGADLAFGSDWTVGLLDPLTGIDAAVNRRTLDGANPNGWVPAQRISLEETLRAYTQGSARAAFMDDRTGTIAEGKYADLVVLSGDLFAVAPTDVTSLSVDLTIVEGEIVYRR
jgi:predicted amidohydrolase YtcJ